MSSSVNLATETKVYWRIRIKIKKNVKEEIIRRAEREGRGKHYSPLLAKPIEEYYEKNTV